MGVTIHYGGSIKSIDLVDELVDEMVEVCNANNWKYQLIDTKTHETVDPNDTLPHLKGIAFGIDEAESVWFTFDHYGMLLSPMVAMFQQHEPEQTKGMDHHAFTKTQSAGPDYHIKIVNIMKYVSNKYFKDWSVKDESEYYETENREHLVECMDIIDKSLAALNEAFAVHGEGMAGKSEQEIKDFIGKVLGAEALDIKVIKLGDEEE